MSGSQGDIVNYPAVVILEFQFGGIGDYAEEIRIWDGYFFRSVNPDPVIIGSTPLETNKESSPGSYIVPKNAPGTVIRKRSCLLSGAKE